MLNSGLFIQQMKLNPEQIKVWLKQTGKDRHWLATKCAVHKSTVDGWFSNRVIPKPAISIITGLMFEDKPIAPKFTLEQFTKIQRQAEKEGVPVDEWISNTVLNSIP